MVALIVTVVVELAVGRRVAVLVTVWVTKIVWPRTVRAGRVEVTVVVVVRVCVWGWSVLVTRLPVTVWVLVFWSRMLLMPGNKLV